MKISSEEKETILNNTDKFYKGVAEEIVKARYYVDTETAKDIALFVEEILKETNYDFKRVIDLTFGSGNLTSHILLDNNIEFETLVLNDKNIDDANNAISFGTVSDKDILDYKLFNEYEPFDLIIFNPQLGGTSYKKGKLKTDSGLNKETLCIYKLRIHIDDALKEKFDLSDCEVNIDSKKHKIFIYSDKLSQSQIKSRIGKLQIFNYFDVFYQSEGDDIVGNYSEIVKFRKTLEKISHDKTIILFLGEENDYKQYFSDYNNYIKYMPKTGKEIYIGKKSPNPQKICYEKEEEDFVLVDCDKNSINEISLDDINLDKLLDDISNDLASLKNLNGSALGIDTSNALLSPTQNPIEEEKPKAQPKFKNFLLRHYKQGN